MKDLKCQLEDFDKSNPISIFFELGYSEADIKASIIETFSPFFENQNNLEEYAISDFVNNWFSYLTIIRDSPESLPYINQILNIFNDAKSVNLDEALNAYTSWYTDMSQSVSRFWSLYNTQSRNIHDLCIEDFLSESLRMIGQTIEGLLKSYLKLIFHLNRIRKQKLYNIDEIRSRDLGVIIDELMNVKELKDLLIMPPHSIRLNQWRNIAYHHNSKVVRNKITCWYKQGDNDHDFSITRDELSKVLQRIMLVFKLIRVSEIIFLYDNISEIQQKVKRLDLDINIRKESKLLEYTGIIGSQGFKIKELEFDENIALMKLQDMQEYPYFLKRAIHSSQFIYSLWEFTKSKKMIIEYYIADDENLFTSEIDSINFIEIGDLQEVTISELLKNINYSYISPTLYQNKNPFQEIDYSQAIKNFPQKYYSQQGENISVEEFSKQFLLTVFSNYLLLKYESDSKIRINIGSDGAGIATNYERDNIVLHVPAMIKCKELQSELINILNRLIGYFEKKELEYEIVEQAKDNNRFYFKRFLIKNRFKELKKG